MTSDLNKKILSDLTVYMKYAKFIPELNRRETWEELVTRNKEMHQKRYPELTDQIQLAYKYVYDKKVLPSMRSLQFSGKPIEISPNRLYNCSYLPIDHVDSFSECMFLLLSGCGVGYSVQKHHINLLPCLTKPFQGRTRRFDIGDSIDRPVKTYSSGMLIRLAFSVQVYVEPDILIVDEALAVGDARFQAKALTKLDEILTRGTTLLFVGHDLNTVRAFCNRAMLLHQGEVQGEGLPDDVITDYLQLVQDYQLSDGKHDRKDVHNGFSVDEYEVVSASIRDHGDHAELSYDMPIEIEIDLKTGAPVAAPVLILDIVDQKGLQLSGRRIPIPCLEESEKSLIVRMRCTFQRGLYRFRLRIVDAPTLEQTRLLSRQDNLISLEMVEDVRDKFTGIFPVPMTCEWSK